MKRILILTLSITLLVLSFILMGCAENYYLKIKTVPITKGVDIYRDNEFLGSTDNNGETNVNYTTGSPNYSYHSIIAKKNEFEGHQEINSINNPVGLNRRNNNVILLKNLNKINKSGAFGRYEIGYDHYWEITFGPIPQTEGKITVITNITNVDIYKNGMIIGNTSSNKKISFTIEEGKYLLKAEKNNYSVIEKDVFIKGGENENVYFDLREKPTSYGYLKLTSNERNVDVYVDGKLKGQIPGGEKPFNKKIRIGEYIIMVKKQFFSPNSIKINIDENEIVPYYFELVKATGGNELTATQSNIYQTKGNLTILTERNDLDVYIDGVKKIPPIQLTEIPAGFYTIRVKSNNLDENFRITVQDKETTIINLDEKYPE